MKRNIFIKSFAISLLSALIIFVSGIGAAYVSNARLISERLVTETGLVSALLGDMDSLASLDRFQKKDECRITVIGMDGSVLYDSDASEPLENHLDREEVAAAMAGSSAPVERYSETFRCRMTYYALQTRMADGSPAVLRLAVKSAQMGGYVRSALPYLCAALLISGLTALFFAKKLSENAADRISVIAQSLRSVNDGRYAPLQADMQDAEFFAVYDEINELNQKTVQHIRREKNEREKLNAVLDNISQGIIALSRDEKIVFVNGSALSLFDCPGDVASKELVYLIDDADVLQKIEAAADGGESRFECLFSDKILLVEIVVPQEPLQDEIGRVIILSDISMQKELARQKEEFFANASHELKTPLTAMIGLSELALAKSGEENTRRQLERIYQESLRLSGLISDMLKLSRLETQQGENTAAWVQVDAIANEVIAELAEAIRAKNITATVSGSVTVLVDEKRMYELMQNLLSNAVNYNKDGGEIHVLLEENAAAAVIRVKDTGIGIAKEHIPHLCERFYRVDPSRSKKTGGTGLGLAIVKHICALYHAEIGIDSEPGVGTEVTVIFKR